MKLETRRNRGRSRKTWIEGATETQRLRNITAYQATENILSRKPIIGGALQCQNTKIYKRKKGCFLWFRDWNHGIYLKVGPTHPSIPSDISEIRVSDSLLSKLYILPELPQSIGIYACPQLYSLTP
jgi:hypothetical protein